VPDNWDETGEDEAVTRSFWSGTITFGLVSIPVALYAANRPRRVSLRMVSPEGTPLNRRYFTSKDDKELDSDDIVRGYEYEKDRFVVVDDDELERLAPERTRDIDVRRFVNASEVDPMYFERAYYLAPTGGSTKAYRLLAKVMEETGTAGIATFVLRAKEYLVVIMAENGILRAETLRFADEVRKPEDVGLPEPAKPAATSVKRIDREIAKLVEDGLDRKELVDHSADRLIKLTQRKLKAGEDVVHVEPRERDEEDGDTGSVIDLMEILKRSIAVAETDADDDAPASPRKSSTPRKSSKASKSTGSSKPAKSSKPSGASKSSKSGKPTKSSKSSKSGSSTKPSKSSKPAASRKRRAST
jgi:DNA end-binding protein Ku